MEFILRSSEPGQSTAESEQGRDARKCRERIMKLKREVKRVREETNTDDSEMRDNVGSRLRDFSPLQAKQKQED
jgi:hypothetical protein